MYLKRRLNDSLTTIKGLHFGQKTVPNAFFRYKATVGIGGNIGDVKRRFEHLLVEIKRDKRVDYQLSKR